MNTGVVAQVFKRPTKLVRSVLVLQLCQDSITEVNGIKGQQLNFHTFWHSSQVLEVCPGGFKSALAGNVALMLEKCKADQTLELGPKPKSSSSQWCMVELSG